MRGETHGPSYGDLQSALTQATHREWSYTTSSNGNINESITHEENRRNRQTRNTNKTSRCHIQQARFQAGNRCSQGNSQAYSSRLGHNDLFLNDVVNYVGIVFVFAYLLSFECCFKLSLVLFVVVVLVLILPFLDVDVIPVMLH